MGLQEELEQLRRHVDGGADGPNPVDAALLLAFLRYLNAAFEELRRKLLARPSRRAAKPDPEIPGPYREAGVFFIPEPARWDRLFAPDAAPLTAAALSGALRAIETENPVLQGVFPQLKAAGFNQSFAQLSTLLQFLGGLSSREAAQAFQTIQDEFPRPDDVPPSLAALLAAMLEPYKGRFYDPCGGAILTGVADFITQGQGKLTDLALYAQERRVESWQLAKMNLIVRGVDTAQILWNADSPLQRDLQGDLKFDFAAAAPPLKEDPYPWAQYLLSRLSPTGLGALVLPRSALAAPGERRRALVEGRVLDCVVNLPVRLFPRPAPGTSICFLSPGKTARGRRSDETLFIDARDLGRPGSRGGWELSGEDISRIARTYHNWRFPKGSPYRDISPFAVTVPFARIRESGWNLNPALYLGIAETPDDTNPADRLAILRAEFEALVKEEARLNRQLTASLRKIRIGP